MVGPASSPAIRIRRGETIVALVWSNTATQLFGRFRVLYDNGLEDDFILNLTLLTNGRLTNLMQCGQTASDNGWVLSGQAQQQPGAANQATQRGQCYIRVCIVSTGPGSSLLPPASMPECRATICSGYIYSGVDVGVGQLIEPGPTGGLGNMRALATADPAAGTEVGDAGPAAGAIWLIRMYTVQLVQGLTQTPLPTLEFETAGSTQIAIIPAMSVALSASSTAQLTWGIGLVAQAFTGVVGDEFYTAPLPVLYLYGSASDVVATLTDGIGANTNYGIALLTVEEWVVPN